VSLMLKSHETFFITNHYSMVDLGDDYV